MNDESPCGRLYEFSTAKKVMMNDLRIDENKEIDLHMSAMLKNFCYLFY